MLYTCSSHLLWSIIQQTLPLLELLELLLLSPFLVLQLQLLLLNLQLLLLLFMLLLHPAAVATLLEEGCKRGSCCTVAAAEGAGAVAGS